MKIANLFVVSTNISYFHFAGKRINIYVCNYIYQFMVNYFDGIMQTFAFCKVGKFYEINRIFFKNEFDRFSADD